MRTAFSTAEKNLFRQRPQRAKWRMAIHKPLTVAEFLTTDVIRSHPPSAIPWHPPISGSTGLIEAGMTAWVGTVQGASDLGKIRIRKNYNGSYLEVAEAGSGLINWEQANYITVKEEFRPWTKHLRYNTATSQWVMDYDETYDGELEIFKPYVNMGAPVIGVLEGGTYTGSFVGERSFSWDSDIAAYAWRFPDGETSIAMGAASAPLHKEFTASSPDGRYVRLDVANDESQANVGRRLIFVFDNKEYAPRVSFGGIEGGVEGGYRATFTTFDAGPFAIQDGAEIVIWEEASYNNVASMVGGNADFRNNVVFRGWVVNESVQINPFTGAATFEAQTVDGYMDKSAAFDLFLARSDPVHSASQWVDAKRLTLDRVAHNLLVHRSTVGGIVDFQPASGLAITEQIRFQSLPKGSWWSQMKTNYHEKGFLGYVAADLQSNIYAFADNQITGGSAGIPFAMHFEQRDRRDTVELDHPHVDTNAQAQLYAVNDDAPLGAESPGQVMGYFGGQVEHQRGLLVDSQDTLITWTGNQRAKLNSKYPRVTVPLAGNYRIDPVPQCRVTMSLSPNQNPRKIHWNDKGFFPKNLSLEYDSTLGIVKSTVELEEIVNGIGGSAITFPRPDEIIPYPVEPPPDEPPPPGDGQGGGLGTAYVLFGTKLVRTRSLSADSPTWSDISLGTVSGDHYDWILDPWRPENRGFLITEEGVWRADGLETDGSPTWTRVLTNAQAVSATSSTTDVIFEYKIIGSINLDNWFACIVRTHSENRLYLAQTDNGGDSWNFHLIVSGNVNSRANGGLDIVPRVVNGNYRLYAGIYRQTGPANTIYIYRSDNKGATWTQHKQLVYSGNPGGATCLLCPYADNQSGNIAWVSFMADGGNEEIYFTTDGFDNYTRPSFSGVSANSHETQVKRLGIEVYTQDSNRIAIWLSTNQLFLSTDGGSNFSEVSFTGYVPATHGDVEAAGGFPFINQRYYIVTGNGYVFVSSDGGSTWTDKSGDIRDTITTPTETDDTKMSVIVPLWTE